MDIKDASNTTFSNGQTMQVTDRFTSYTQLIPIGDFNMPFTFVNQTMIVDLYDPAVSEYRD